MNPKQKRETSAIRFTTAFQEAVAAVVSWGDEVPIAP